MGPCGLTCLPIAVAATIAGDRRPGRAGREGRQRISGNRAPPWHRYLSVCSSRASPRVASSGPSCRTAWRLLETERASLGRSIAAGGTRSREAAIAAQLAWLEGRAEEALAVWERALDHDEEIDLIGQAAEARVRLARALAMKSPTQPQC